MTIPRSKPAGWGANEKLTSGQQNQLDTQLTWALEIHDEKGKSTNYNTRILGRKLEQPAKARVEMGGLLDIFPVGSSQCRHVRPWKFPADGVNRFRVSL